MMGPVEMRKELLECLARMDVVLEDEGLYTLEELKNLVEDTKNARFEAARKEDIEEEEEEMTREEKLRSMKKDALLEEARKLGLTLAKKMRNNDIVDRILAAEMIDEAVADTEKEEETMKEVTRQEVNEAVDKAIAAIEDAEDVLEPVIVDDKEEAPQEVTEPVAEKPEKKADRFTDLLRLVPTTVNADITCKSVQGNTVSVKLGAARIFRLAGNGKRFELFTDRDLVGTLFEMILAGELDGSGISYGGDTDGAPSELTVQHYVKGNRRSYGIIKLSKEQVVDIMTQILEII